jgi:hypothetical protein
MMIEYVYQVRIYEGYNEKFLNYYGEWEFEEKNAALECYNLYYDKYKNDNIRITRTPKLDEDECEELGIEYEIEIII